MVFSQGEFTQQVRQQLSGHGVKGQNLVWQHGDVTGPSWNDSYLVPQRVQKARPSSIPWPRTEGLALTKHAGVHDPRGHHGLLSV